MVHIWETPEWKALQDNAVKMEKQHLRDVMQDAERGDALRMEWDEIVMDFSRQNLTPEVMKQLVALAEKAELKEKVKAMYSGVHINSTEDRAVLHVALRAPEGEEIVENGENVVPEVHRVLEKVYFFAEKVRSGSHSGATGKKLTNVISIGIGGSYLGPEFVYEALRTDKDGAVASQGRRLRFLANVDPTDVARATEGLNPEETLVVVVSKTFTTAETLLNARTLKRWLENAAEQLGVSKEDMISKHVVAVSTNLEKTSAFGIAKENVFTFSDWVGGRYSVSSPVGVVPLSLQYGPKLVKEFLAGAWSMDEHFISAPLESNMPVLLGLLGVWNTTFMRRPVEALLPYSQALLRFPAHIQQVSMESNGKRVTLDGTVLPFDAGEVIMGEPGTNGQRKSRNLMKEKQEHSRMAFSLLQTHSTS